MKIFNKENIKNFDDVLNFLNTIACINTGGCGISALAMYRWLKKHGLTTEQTAFYFLEDDENNHINNKQYFSNKEVMVKASSHVVLFHNDQTIDCSGFVPIDVWNYHLLENSEEFLLAMINNCIWTWNYKFNRKEQVPEIAKTLEIDLSDVIIRY